MANVPLLPLGAKFYGAFCKTLGSNPTEHSAAYVTWDFPNSTWKATIDAMKAIGGNFLVVAGTPFFTLASPISTATYVARRCVIADYMAEKGMYMLPYGMLGYANWNGATNTEVCDVIAADAEALSKRDNVIGYVTMDEPWLGSVVEGGAIANATVVSDVAAQYAAVKAVVPTNFGVCAASNQSGDFLTSESFGYTGSTGVYTSTRGKCDFVAAYCDFFAIHVFVEPAAADSATLRAAFAGKELIMPSSVLVEVGDPDIAAKFQTTMDLVTDNAWCRGMGPFSTLDGTSVYGMFNTGPPVTPRTTITDEFEANLPAVVDPAWPVRSFPGSPRLNQLIRWGN